LSKNFVNMMLNILLTSMRNEYMITLLEFKSRFEYDFLSSFKYCIQVIKLSAFWSTITVIY